MNKRLAALLVLAAGTSLSGCVAAVIPAIAGSTMVGSRVLKEGEQPEPAATPAPAPTPTPSRRWSLPLPPLPPRSPRRRPA